MKVNSQASPKTTETETLGQGSCNLYFNKPSWWFWCRLIFEKYLSLPIHPVNHISLDRDWFLNPGLSQSMSGISRHLNWSRGSHATIDPIRLQRRLTKPQLKGFCSLSFPFQGPAPSITPLDGHKWGSLLPSLLLTANIQPWGKPGWEKSWEDHNEKEPESSYCASGLPCFLMI